MSQIITDAQYKCATHKALSLASQNAIPTWTYQFAHTPNCPWLDGFPQEAIQFVGATHTADLPFVWGNGVNLPEGEGNCSFTANETIISDFMVEAWGNMAAFGTPNGGNEAVYWPSWNESASFGVVIEDTVGVGIVDYEICKFWETVDLAVLDFKNLSSTSTTSGTPTSTHRATSTASVVQSGSNSRTGVMFGGMVWVFVTLAAMGNGLF